MSPAPESKQDRRPPYQHAADELRRDILQGRIKPGEQMPAIRELQERFGVANMTMRSALNVLRDEGLIYTIHGRGSFVADHDGGGEFSANYTAPAWYLSKKGQAEPGEGRPDDAEAAGANLADILTSLRDEIRALSADHQELRREVEELKAAQQSKS
ncbi:GntR family transcriptional regulator [Streptomyces caniscabiei]|uniref:GntR family transcriptional regulator n=1 Tax=Streptomyces caniscabiei TaxID=2746961 RepID=A0ABU4N6Y3_9ACTN|nr:GntR family transcriptional regulator [Streptomyces caniscabiei]MBE4741972.1 GntR family transcriptional regulator [Streptomyces caniscabiei]MBE4753799.1 GntR family transcriptional regulator [Streptomyces caniscabiei]MBE4775996.1 GntR family transcriptional regulator [Streptomyces caniscabiei]MBE4790788.1 GntR family transcriptional regulator [Streptomyces caniscabiei]MBE4799961.1 GntR family transcriptional regulator [Streptomyces caniscabiei]